MQVQDKVSEILKAKPSRLFSVSPNSTVFEGLELIAREDIGCVLVKDGPTLLGVFSEREYARNVALQGRQSRETNVTEVMFAPPITVTPDTPLDEAMRLMTDNRIRHLPVIENESVVGLVSMSDAVKWIITEQERTIQQLHSYINGYSVPVLTGS